MIEETEMGIGFLLTRELGNGIWFMLSVSMVGALWWFAWSCWRDRAHWETGPWAFLAAVTLGIFILGSGIRAGAMWTAWLVTPSGRIPLPWLSSTTAYMVAIVFGVAGAAGCWAVFKRWQVWLPVIGASIAVPVVAHFLRKWM